MSLNKLISNPKIHIIFFMLILLVLVLVSNFQGINSYQIFTEKLARGQVDFSQPGFHGVDFLAVPIYLITNSAVASRLIDIILVIFSIPLFYLLGKEIFKSKKLGIFLAYAYVLMPLDWLDMFRGEHHSAFIFFFVLGLYLIFKSSKWSWLVIGFSYIIKPYAIFAAPFFWYKKLYKQFILSFIIPFVYLIFQILQTNQIMLGSHPNETANTLFNFKNFIFNLIYVIQNIFSVHNFSPNLRVYFTDMSHITPILVILAIIAIFKSKQYFTDKRLFSAILTSAIIGLLIPVSFEYLDMWRIIIFYLAIILLALPVIKDYKFLIPISVGLSGFQFYYSYLHYQTVYWSSGNKFLFVIWAIIFLISLIYFYINHHSFPSLKRRGGNIYENHINQS
ncbi:hypothetical protein KKC16_03010 [Patescibacteria group bacterium]|nr:hypothetical protein [Patescibacteria group bacterium]